MNKKNGCVITIGRIKCCSILFSLSKRIFRWPFKLQKDTGAVKGFVNAPDEEFSHSDREMLVYHDLL